MKKIGVLMGLSFIMIFAISCTTEPNEDMLVHLEGYVYQDSTLAVPQPDVMVKVKIDNGERVPDVVGFTDSEGHFSLSFYLGHEWTSCGFKPVYIANVEILYFYGGNYFKFTDVTVEAGESYELPAVHLGMFEEYSGG